MAPKAKKAELEEHDLVLLPPRLTVADIQNTWEESSVGEYFARVLVNEIVGEMEHEIVRAHMDHTAVPWTVQSVVTDLMECILLNFIEREGGMVTETDGPDVEEQLVEPLTTDADSWARASMLQRSLLVRPDAEQFVVKPTTRERRLGARADRTPTEGDNLMGTINAAASRMLPNLNTVMNSHLTSGPSTAAGLNRLGLQSTRFGTGAGGGGHADRLKSIVSVRSIESGDGDQGAGDLEYLTAEERRLLELQQKSAERMAYLRSVSERLNKQFQEVRNKPDQYVVDGSTNTVLIVTKPDPKRLPTASEPKVSIPSDEPPSPAPNPRGARGGRQSPVGASPGLGGKKDAQPKPKRPDQSTFWEPEQQTNPMILGVAPVPGVTSKEGDLTKRAELRTQKSRISKSEYSKLLILQQQARIQSLDPGLDGQGNANPAPSGESKAISVDGQKKSQADLAASIRQPRSLSGSGPGDAKGPSAAATTATAPPAPVAAKGKQSSKPVPVPVPSLGSRPASRVDSRPSSVLSKRGDQAQKPMVANSAVDLSTSPNRAARTNPLHIPRAGSATPQGGLQDVSQMARAITPTVEAAVGQRRRGVGATRAGARIQVLDPNRAEDEITRDFLNNLSQIDEHDGSGSFDGRHSPVPA